MKLGKPSKRSRRRAEKARNRERRARQKLDRALVAKSLPLLGDVISAMGNVADELRAERLRPAWENAIAWREERARRGLSEGLPADEVFDRLESKGGEP